MKTACVSECFCTIQSQPKHYTVRVLRYLYPKNGNQDQKPTIRLKAYIYPNAAQKPALTLIFRHFCLNRKRFFLVLVARSKKNFHFSLFQSQNHAHHQLQLHHEQAITVLLPVPENSTTFSCRCISSPRLLGEKSFPFAHSFPNWRKKTRSSLFSFYFCLSFSHSHFLPFTLMRV